MSGLVRHASQVSERRSGNDSLAARELIDATDGCELFTMRLLRCVAGRSAQRQTGAAQELLFVIAGAGALITAAGEHELDTETGVLLGSHQQYELDNHGPADLEIVAVSLHTPSGESPSAAVLSRLADQAAQAATAEREFRIVFDPDNGCASATQFVGYIPVGAAPPHYHHYDEVIYVLEGQGVMHMNDTQTPLEAGSVIHLPARKVHTLANSGPGIMRVLGVFRPAGSPAAAFYPDGTPATYVAEAPKTASIAT
jgi:mannose-6-phosphate isomerase-like protein (cupin superfamily)